MKPQYRRARTPLVKKVEDLMNVQGIGEKNFLKLKPLIGLGQPKTDKGTQHH
jgi:DNA uptake protein ComE-like DNA-binding protein